VSGGVVTAITRRIEEVDVKVVKVARRSSPTGRSCEVAETPQWLDADRLGRRRVMRHGGVNQSHEHMATSH
jgi:hypothetical protein